MNEPNTSKTSKAPEFAGGGGGGAKTRPDPLRDREGR